MQLHDIQPIRSRVWFAESFELAGHLVVAVLNLRLSFCVRALNMAAIHFGSAVDDEKEGNLRLQAAPERTKSATNWGISVWKEWVTARSVKAADGQCSVSTPLLAMPVDDFAYWLGRFILEFNGKDGTE